MTRKDYSRQAQAALIQVHAWLANHWGEGPIDGTDLELVDIDEEIGALIDVQLDRLPEHGAEVRGHYPQT